jgi:K+-sensing histidine kinase KdpD
MQRLANFYIDVPALRPGTVWAYAFAFLCAAVATALRIAIDPYVVGVPFITYFPAVIITAVISGFGAGLFCVAFSAAAVDFFVISPRLSFYVERPADAADLVLFILEALFYVILIGGMRLTLERYRDLSHNLELRVEERSAALRENQERLKAVVAELQHRTRNLISVVGTMAKGALGSSKTFDDFSATFQDRLEVLGRTQGLLFRTEAGGRVTFDELIDTELAAQSIRVGEHGPVTLDGPKGIPLRSRTVQSLAMALPSALTRTNPPAPDLANPLSAQA